MAFLANVFLVILENIVKKVNLIKYKNLAMLFYYKKDHLDNLDHLDHLR